MKASLILSLSTLLAIGVASADVPRKPSNASYAHLWNNSPFTSKPPPPVQGEQVGAFDDWALAGVSEIEGGYMVTLQHKKNAGEYQIIRPRGVQMVKPDEIKWLDAGAAGAFKVERVEPGKTGWKDMAVYILAGGKTGVVRFDEKNLTPKASAAPQGNRPGQQPGKPGAQPVPGQPTPPATGGRQPRQPRQRVLPPPPQR